MMALAVALDDGDVLFAQSLRVGKVEAQAIWRHQRAGLMDVAAQPRAARRAGRACRVVAHDVPTPHGVDYGLGGVAHFAPCRS
jgi:hypothetical protein